MINKIRAQEHHHRKLIVYMAAGFVTSIIGGIYFYSIFSQKILAGNSNESVKQTSPAKDLINSLIYVGKEASTAVKTGIEKTKQNEIPSADTQSDETMTPTSESTEQEYTQTPSIN